MGPWTTWGHWSKTESMRSNNARELQAAILTVKALEDRIYQERKSRALQQIIVRLQTDNIVTATYLNKQGGRSFFLSILAERFLLWCRKRKIRIQATYLPGKLNRVPDQLSRRRRDRSDWKLNPRIFNRIQQIFGQMSIDLFASRLNHQLPSYFSLQPDHRALATDAFAQSWKKGLVFANPPIILLTRTLQKIILEKAEAVIIAPWWPTQPWFPLLRRLAVQPPRWLPAELQTFLPGTHRPPHQLNRTWRFAAWRISGARKGQRGFHPLPLY